MRFELMTSAVPRRLSTPELRGRESNINRVQLGAGDETRTRDPQLGRLMLYQLSYTRPTHYRLPIFDYRHQSARKFQSAIDNSKSTMTDGAGGRIRTYVGQ